MNFKSIDNKKIKDGKLRITEPVIVFPENAQTIAIHEVTADETCRIDIISRRYYGSEDYSELILKFNNISNPFSIVEGDVLYIPNKDIAFPEWKTVNGVTGSSDGEGSEGSVKDQFVNSKRLTVKDANRAEYLKRKAAQKINGSTEIVPPNILKSGDKNIDINGDIITI